MNRIKMIKAQTFHKSKTLNFIQTDQPDILNNHRNGRNFSIKQQICSNRKYSSQKIPNKSSTAQKKKNDQTYDSNSLVMKDGKVILPTSFYFNSETKKSIIKKVVNNYLDSGLNDLNLTTNPETSGPFSQRKSFVNSRFCRTAQQFRRKNPSIVTSQTENLRKTSQKYRQQINPSENKSLPIISQLPQPFDSMPVAESKSTLVQFDVSPLFKKRRSLLRSEGMSNNNSISLLSQGKYSEASQDTIPFIVNGKKQCKYFTYKKNPQDSIISEEQIMKQFTQQGKSLLNNELKIKKMGAPTLWSLSQFKQNTLVTKNYTVLNRQVYYKVKRQHAKETVYKIIPLQTYDQLFTNKNQQITNILSGLCDQLLRIEGKIITNNIRFDNIIRKGQKKIYLADWTNAAIKESLIVQGQSLIKYHDPFLKDNTKFVCRPEYLAPEIIKGAQYGFNHNLLWADHSFASDIWSIGCFLFEILTLIPLGASERYSVKGRNHFRKGLLHLATFTTEEFLRKQKLFLQQYMRILKVQAQNVNVEDKFFQIIEGCLKIDREDRITPSRILDILKS